MQNSNPHSCRAMLRTIDSLRSSLEQMAAISCIASESNQQLHNEIVHSGIWQNLQKLINEAQICSGNLEFTLIEELKSLYPAEED